MLTKHSTKLNNYIVAIGIVLLVLTAVVGFTLSTIFNSLNKSREIDTSLLESSEIRIAVPELEKALDFAFSRDFVPLDLPE